MEQSAKETLLAILLGFIRVFELLILFVLLGEVHEDVVERHLSDGVIFDDVLQVFSAFLEHAEHSVQWHLRGHTEVDHFVMLFFDVRLGYVCLDVVDHMLRAAIDCSAHEDRVAVTESFERKTRRIERGSSFDSGIYLALRCCTLPRHFISPLTMITSPRQRNVDRAREIHAHLLTIAQCFAFLHRM